MRCPKCEGFAKVIDNVNNSDTNEVYRKRLCIMCGYEFFTSETEIDGGQRFKNIWSLYHRKSN